MPYKQLLVGILGLLLGLPPAVGDAKLRLAQTLRAFEQDPSPQRLGNALEAAFQADDWTTGLRLARKVPADAAVPLRGLALRSLWRAGALAEASVLADGLPTDTRDPETLGALALVRLGQGRWSEGDELLGRLEQLGPTSAYQLYSLVTQRMQRGQTRNLARLASQTRDLLNEERGYPDNLLNEASEGLPDLAKSIGDRPLNRTTVFGSCDMPAIAGLGMPSVTVYLNGKGPYRLLLDTGGSITLSLDTKAAREVGLPELAQSKIHGVGGAQDAFMSIIDDVQLGDIALERVMCHAFEMPDLLGGIHGILGTGVFLNERFTLDFETGQVHVEPSSRKGPKGGKPLPLWIVSDAKVLAWAEIDGKSGAVLIDSGADSSVLSPAFARRRFPHSNLFETPLPTAAGVGAGQEGSILLVPAVELDLGGFKPEGFGGVALSTLDDTLGPIIGVQCNAIIGMNMLRQMRSFTVDGPSSRGWIRWIE